MKIIAFVFLALSSIAAHADPLFDDAALKICTAQYYDVDKVSCMQQIKGQRYEARMLNVCAAQYYDSQKRACLEIAANRHFVSDAELAVCVRQYHDADKLACLREAEHIPLYAYTSETKKVSFEGLDPQFVESLSVQASSAIAALQAGDPRLAEDILRDLKRELGKLPQKQRLQ